MTEEFRVSAERRWLAANLVEALKLLAAPYEDQIAALPSFVVVADELALEFDAAYSALEPSELPASVVPALGELDAELDRLSSASRVDAWSLDAVQHGADWAAIRERANRILAILSIPYDRPSIDRAGYVETNPDRTDSWRGP
jgi:hypothetical protein